MTIVEWLAEQTSLEEQSHHLTHLGDVAGEQAAQICHPRRHVLNDCLGIKRRCGVQPCQLLRQGVASGKFFAQPSRIGRAEAFASPSTRASSSRRSRVAIVASPLVTVDRCAVRAA
jgi:hypothetical protein